MRENFPLGEYTVYPDWVDAQIQQHMDIVAEEVVRAVDDIVSILLVGGFGRGEGTVLLEDGIATPINDYDLYLVSERGVSEHLINQISARVETRIGTQGYSRYEDSPFDHYLDIRSLRVGDLPKLPSLIKYYELKHTSRLLYGRDTRSLLPAYQVEDLPLSEGVRFLFNRMSHILEWFPIEYFQGLLVPAWKKQTLRYAITKIYLESCTALTLLAGCYQPTYRGRLQALEQVFERECGTLAETRPGLLERIHSETDCKLHFQFPQESDEALVARWFQAREDILAVTRYYLQRYAGISDWNQFYAAMAQLYFKPYLQEIIYRRTGIALRNGLPLAVLNRVGQYGLRLIWFFRVFHLHRHCYVSTLMCGGDPGIRIFEAMPYLLECINHAGEIALLPLQQAARSLKSIYPIRVPSDGTLSAFDRVRIGYIDAWKLYYFQKIV